MSGVLAQDPTPEPGSFHLYLVPSETQGLTFLTHVVEVEIVQNPDFTAEYNTVSTYRLHNATEEPRIVHLALRTITNTGGEPAYGQLKKIQLFEGANTVPLESLQGNGYKASIALEPDERAHLELHYLVHAAGRYFPEVVYDVSPLQVWALPPESMRFSVYTDSELSQRTLQKVTPADFDVQDGEVRWLFENSWPWSPLQVRFIHKAAWNLIRQAEETEDKIALGQLFHTLYMVNLELPLGERQIFYDQALAALLQAVDDEPGLAHYSLAQLYRTQLLQSLLPGKATYLERVLYHARQGLEYLPDELEIQRMELTRWLMDGLEMQISIAVQRGDWSMVDYALAEVESLPSAWVPGERIEEIRRNTRLQQAIWLLNDESLEEASELVGSQMDSSNTMPPPEAISLFQGWLTTVVASPDSLSVTMEGTVDPSQFHRLSEKLTQLEQLAARSGSGQEISWKLAEVPNEVLPRRVLQLHLQLTDEKQANQLASLLGADADWILLQTILQEPWPQVSVHNQLLFQDQVYNYALNLEDVYRLWGAKAQHLDQEAIREASEGADGPDDLVRQFNYMDTAQNWRNLARYSVVLVSLKTDVADQTQETETWVATQEDPLLQARIGSHSLRIPILAILGSALLVFLVAFATWLNRLLRPPVYLAGWQTSRIPRVDP